MKNLSRLNAVMSLVPKGSVIDIGSDHGYLAVMLLQNGICTFAVASDINEQPLERSKQTSRIYGVENKMKFFLSDGLDSVEGDYDTACICGMGGNLIADIIKRGRGRCKSWVCQPMTNCEVLRKYLWDNGYEIENEAYAVESGKPYAVILAADTGKHTAYTYSDMYLGRIRPESNEYKRFTEKILASAKKRLNGRKLRNMPFDGEENLVAECEMIINRQ